MDSTSRAHWHRNHSLQVRLGPGVEAAIQRGRQFRQEGSSDRKGVQAGREFKQSGHSNSCPLLGNCLFSLAIPHSHPLLSASQISLLSLVYKEANMRLGSLIARLDLSTFDAVAGLQLSTRSLDSPQWRRPKSKQRKPKQHDPILPGCEVPESAKQTSISVGSNIGIVSGFEFRVRR